MSRILLLPVISYRKLKTGGDEKKPLNESYMTSVYIPALNSKHASKDEQGELIPDYEGMLGIVQNTALFCWAKQYARVRLIAPVLQKYDLDTSAKFMAYVKRSNFYSEVESFHMDKQVLESCPGLG